MTVFSLGNSLIAVKSSDTNHLIKSLNILDIHKDASKDAFKYFYENFSYKIPEDNLYKIIVSEKFQEWNLIYLSAGFEKIKKLIEYLIVEKSISANYYYGDSHTDTYEWIITNDSNIVRAFQYCMGEISCNEGLPLTLSEEKFINYTLANTIDTTTNIEFVFGEDALWDILEKSCKIYNIEIIKALRFHCGYISMKQFN
ncbi:MAG: hypothetical protein JNK27_08465 [Chitinophagaceae bacterium]|nr:hypothetical protein [Chitinophagaceae bacterium]